MEQGNFHYDCRIKVLNTGPDRAEDMGVSHLLQLLELDRVVEHDAAEHRPVDAPLDDHLRPCARNLLEGGSSRLQYLMAQCIGIDGVHPSSGQQVPYGCLSAPDTTAEYPAMSLISHRTGR